METLDTAPLEIQLAVDLIYLLESAEVDTSTVLKALEMVKQDYLKKQAAEAACQNGN
ncbi:DUF2496 domain-containing protein [Providencia alcalifaciens]|uniref:DUF2496 domain-containing protein n=1 Tax=Providencia alcalifaciens TaxID=126385 RepID=UPI001CE058B9|nr:DUF2496 domain-containing protein [Providencia alcalifaciens]UBX49501.1 DUF2496 domain-containing protein [Providencia alcalifaciens]